MTKALPIALTVLAPLATCANLYPVALSFLPTGELILLNSTGLISKIDVQTARAANLGQVYVGGSVVDMCACSDGQNPILLITTSGRAPSGSSVLGYSLSKSKIYQKWILPAGVPSGLACDFLRHTVYVSNLAAPEIFRIDLGAHKGPQYIATQLRSTERLGAIALDTKGQHLYVADPFSGSIVMYDLETRHSTVIAQGLGSPTACVFDAASERLIVTDADKHCLWAIEDLGQRGGGTKRVLLNSQDLKQPTALALGSDGSLWVGDLGLRCVRRYSADEHMTAEIK